MFSHTQDGELINDSDVALVYDQIEKIFDNIEGIADDLEEKGQDITLGSLLDKKFNEYLKSLSSKTKLSEEKIQIIKAIYEARLKEEIFDNACADLDQLSTVGWNEYEDCAGDNLTNLKNGYGELVEYFVSKIPPERILLNEQVIKIQYPNKDQENDNLSDYVITVTTFNNETQKESTYYALQCLCTISLGVLKDTYKTLFEPSLPGYKINAIQKLGFGVVNKVFIVFGEPVFDGNVQGMQLLWREDLDLDLKTTRDLKNPYFYRSFGSFEVLPKSPNILYTFIGGEDAKYLETIKDETTLVDIFDELFQRCFSDKNMPRPMRVLRSRWYSNEFEKGSYSFVKIGASIGDIKALASSVNNKLHFAGEATHSKYFSTVHGAYASGLTAANKILNELKKH